MDVPPKTQFSCQDFRMMGVSSGPNLTSLYQLQSLVQDLGLTTTDGVVFVPHCLGCGFLGMKIHPGGQENFNVQMLMDSSKQTRHLPPRQDKNCGHPGIDNQCNCSTIW